MGEYQKKARDNARTPMQWSSATHAGFTSPKSTPWMNAMPNHKTINAESQLSDPSSTFNYWRSMLAMRKKYKDIIVYGDFEVLDEKSESVISFLRTGEDGKEAILTLCNFSADTVVWKGNVNGLKAVAMSNQGRTLEDFNSGEVKLEAYEGLALLIESPGRKKTALP
jgi:glycosidase